jgi:hypothetical protein
VGTCDLGQATVDLDGNNVRARLYNTGGLFWRGAGNVYTVPKDGQVNAIFASGIWIGGLDADGELRFAGTDYGPFEYWPGPLDSTGNPPDDCSQYDRIYKVSREDLLAYERHGTPTQDMLDWPWQLGASVWDGDGMPDNYDLKRGDRPGLVGEQTAWWVMNDAGNVKEWPAPPFGFKNSTAFPPIGLEVQVTAFAFHTSGALDNTTYYRYRLIHKGTEPLRETWFGLWSDPDLGNTADDYIGTDTTLGLGYVYNADNFDEGPTGYGVPPALGYKIIQGPLVPDPVGDTWIDPDGTEHPGMRRLGMTRFIWYRGLDCVICIPGQQRSSPYEYLRGVWPDGNQMTYGGSGYGGLVPAHFIFPGDPVTRSYWSEENTDGAGWRNRPADRRFVLSTGPFDLEPGDVQEIVVAIVWAQGADYRDSILALREAACVAHNRIDDRHRCQYVRPEIPEPGPVRTLLSPADGVTGQPTGVTFAWEEDPDPYTIGYDIEVAPEPDFASPVSASTTDATVRVQLERDTPYWWRVRRNVPGIQGPWSDPWRFSTGSVSTFTSGAGGITSFQTVSNAAGPLDPPEMGAYAFEGNGFPTFDGGEGPTDRQQVSGGLWGIHTGEGYGPTYDDFVRRSIRNGWGNIVPWDWEIRFTERCRAAWETAQASGDPYGSFPADACYAYDRFGVITAAGDTPTIVPYELWDIGIGTPDDPGDDVRLIPAVIDWDGEGWNLQCSDHEVSDGSNDPVTDWLYMYLPDGNDRSPGEAGYEAWMADLLAGTATDHHGSEVMARLAFVNLDGGNVSTCDPRPPFTSEMPEAGTVFRIVTAKPIVPILASPGPGATLPTGTSRFFWSAMSLDTVRLDVRSASGGEWTVDNAASGLEIELAEPGAYTWRAVSAWKGPSEWWPFEVVSGVGTEEGDALPTTVELAQNYPNPFNPSTVIRFGLPEATDVWLEMYDVTGRRVMSLLSGARYPAGYHEVTVRPDRLASGIYLYRLQAGGVRRTGRMVLVR